jgi:uncharacterized membrane protein YhaH (DUF805 family)
MKYFIDALRRYADFSGRASRKEYWYFVLFNCLFAFAFGFFSALLKVEFLSNVYTLAMLIPGISVGVRRMHDTGKSGWYILVPILNLVIACTQGDPGENEYGPEPNVYQYRLP